MKFPFISIFFPHENCHLSHSNIERNFTQLCNLLIKSQRVIKQKPCVFSVAAVSHLQCDCCKLCVTIYGVWSDEYYRSHFNLQWWQENVFCVTEVHAMAMPTMFWSFRNFKSYSTFRLPIQMIRKLSIRSSWTQNTKHEDGNDLAPSLNHSDWDLLDQWRDHQEVREKPRK